MGGGGGRKPQACPPPLPPHAGAHFYQDGLRAQPPLEVPPLACL